VLTFPNDLSFVKNARFTDVVKKAGAPEPHLVLTKPEEDSDLRKTIKEHRVMTVFQETVGQKADRGTVGFEPGMNRQFLIFPKSLRSFEGKKIVGIKYDLIKLKELPKSQRATPPKPPKPAKPPLSKKEKAIQLEEMFEPVEKARSSEEEEYPKQDEAVAAIKKQVRRAMKILEQGKAVAAFNLLKKIVDE